MSYSKWSFEEVSLLKNLYPNVRIRDLVDKFPDRNARTIVVKALGLGLPSAKLWQPEENEVLKKSFINATKDELLKLLPRRTWCAIMAQGERLGIKRKRDKPRLSVNEDFFKYWSHNMAYILGFILADGCIIKGTYKGYSDSLKFGVQLGDIDILEKIRKELNAGHKITIINNAAHFCIASQKIVNDLKKLGISYRKSLNEQLPKIPPQYLRDFFRGVVDGDGGIRIDKKGQPSIGLCGGETVVTFIRDYFLKNMKLYSRIGRRSYSKQQKSFLYEIRYRSNTALKIIAYLYNDKACLYLNRKYELAKKCMKLKIKERRIYEQYKFGSS